MIHTETQTVAIAAAGTTSAAFDMAGRELISIRTDADFVSANLTFVTDRASTGSFTDDVQDAEGDVVTITGVAANKLVAMLGFATCGWGHTKIVSSASQTTGTILYLTFKTLA